MTYTAMGDRIWVNWFEYAMVENSFGISEVIWSTGLEHKLSMQSSYIRHKRSCLYFIPGWLAYNGVCYWWLFDLQARTAVTRIIQVGLVLKQRTTSAIAHSSMNMEKGIHTRVNTGVTNIPIVCRTRIPTAAERRGNAWVSETKQKK